MRYAVESSVARCCTLSMLFRLDGTKMASSLTLLLLATTACTARNTACEWYPSSKYMDRGMQCSGKMVTRVPVMLPTSLELLRLTGTAIASLDTTTFHDRVLAELTTLKATDGILASVGADAFCSLPALTMLDLSHNQLHLIHNLSLNCNKHLRIVNLANNPILQLPHLVTSSVETLRLDYCSLGSIDVADVEGMTALNTLSLIGNPDLDCAYVKRRLGEARPDLVVMCENSTSDHASPLEPMGPESSTQNPLESHPAVINTENGASGLPPSLYPDDPESTTQNTLNTSDVAVMNEANGASGLSVTFTIIACLSVIPLIIFVLAALKSFRDSILDRNNLSLQRSYKSLERMSI